MVIRTKIESDAYSASWSGDMDGASKSVLYDKIEAVIAGGHDPVTVSDSAEIDFTLTGQDITASLVAGSIDETKLDASVNASLDLADTAVQAPAGSDTQVQYNNAGAFGASANLTFNGSKLAVTGDVTVSGGIGLGTSTPSCPIDMQTAGSGDRIKFGTYTIGSSEAGPYPSGFYAVDSNSYTFHLIRSASTHALMAGGVDGDARRRILMAADGDISIGDGTNTRDVSVGRVSAGVWGVKTGGLQAYGSDTHVQVNRSGIMGGSSALTHGLTTGDLHTTGTNAEIKSTYSTVDVYASFAGYSTLSTHPRGVFRLGRTGSSTITNVAMWVTSDAGTNQKDATLEALTNIDSSTNSTKRLGMRATTTGSLIYFGRAGGNDGDQPMTLSTNGVSTTYHGIYIAEPANNGMVGVNVFTTPSGQLHTQSASSTTITNVVQAAASQSANLTEWQDSSVNVLTSIQSNGYVAIGSSTIPATNRHTKLYIEGNGSGTTGRTDFYVRNTTANSAASFRLENNAGNYLSVQCSGTTYTGGTKASFGTSGLDITFGTNGDVSTGGTNNITFGPGGYDASNDFVIFHSDHKIGVHNLTPSATFDLKTKNASTVGMLLTASATQTANIFEARDASDTLATRLNSTGKFLTSLDLEITGSANGLILESPDATRWRITVSDSGILSAVSI